MPRMLRPAVLVILLVMWCGVLSALEAGKDPVLDKAIADQFSRDVRKLVYEMLTVIEKKDLELAGVAKKNPDLVTVTGQFQGWRERIIQGECREADIREEIRRSKLSPEEREKEGDAFLKDLMRQREKEKAAGGTAP